MVAEQACKTEKMPVFTDEISKLLKGFFDSGMDVSAFKNIKAVKKLDEIGTGQNILDIGRVDSSQSLFHFTLYLGIGVTNHVVARGYKEIDGINYGFDGYYDLNAKEFKEVDQINSVGVGFYDWEIAGNEDGGFYIVKGIKPVWE